MEPFPPHRRGSDGRRVAAAIGLGCGGVLLLLVLLVGGCAYWALTPGPQDATFRIIGPESPGFAHLNDLRESPAARAILQRYLAEMERVSRSLEGSELPEGMGWLGAFRGQRGDRPGLLDLAAPAEATLAIEWSPESGSSAFIAAVNFRYFTRLARLLFDWAGEGTGLRELEYGDHAVYGLVEPPLTLSFRGGTLVVGSTLEDLFTGLDRLDQTTDGGPTEPSGGFLSDDETGDLYGVIPGSDFVGLLLPDVLPDPQVLEEVRFGVRIDSPDSIRARLGLSCTDPPAAIRVSHLVRQLAGAWARELEPRGLQLVPRVRVDGSQVVADLSVSGIGSAIEIYADGIIADLEREQRAGSS